MADPAGGVVLDYCAAVRGILNDDQGGPLHPPGVRMAEALRGYPVTFPCNSRYLKGTGFLDVLGFKSMSIR